MQFRSFLFTSAAFAAASLPSMAAAEELAVAPDAQSLAGVETAQNSADADLGVIALEPEALSQAQGFIAAVPSVDSAPVDIEPSAQTFDLASEATSPAQMAANSVVAVSQYSGASTPEKREDSFSILMNQDSFFGFYPSFNGLVPIGDNIDLSFYGIFWTTDGFGPGLGSDLWHGASDSRTSKSPSASPTARCCRAVCAMM